ncbi:hypothetical protein FRC12_008164 [Ceratobasidium sp. 428]|nr:hypothetical protein FRC12_008164 [Ceratobasidium sp. 428]
MRNRSSERTGAPPNVFDDPHAQGTIVNSASNRQSAVEPSQAPLPQSSKPPPDTFANNSGSRSQAAKSDPVSGDQNAGVDSDVDMFDAESSLGDDYGAGGPPKGDLLSKLPNIFRLLDLYQEIGSGGLVEKMIIDQHSLYRLLNAMSPGSYELPWKINFKHLDQIVKFLQGVNFLDKESEALLSATASSASGLRSGLYIVLPLNNGGQDDSTRSAYIVYWPEDTTWEDKAISSVRRNRVTFMRYLSKLTDQTIALVSTQQAEVIVWQAGARNKDAPVGAAESSDESRMNFFEVAMFDKSEEDVIASPGFTIHPESRDIPRIDDALRVELLSGEEKAGLMVSTHEPAHYSKATFNRTMTSMALRSTIESKNVPCVLWSKIAPEHLLVLGEHGLRTIYPKPFFEYEERMRAEKRSRDHGHQEEKKSIESQIDADKPRLKEFITRTIQALLHKIYPLYVHDEAPQETGSTEDALLCEHYPDLRYLPNEIKSKYNLAVIEDHTFKNLKQAWCITRDFLTQELTPSKSDQKEFIRKILAGLEADPSKEKGTSKSKGFFRALLELIPGLPKSYSETQDLKDPEFVAALDTLLHIYPTVSELTARIVNSIETYHATLAKSILKESRSRVIKREQERRLETLSQLQAGRASEQSHAALSILHEQLKEAMPPDVSRATRIDSIELARSSWGSKSFHVRGVDVKHVEPQTRISIFPLELTEHDIQQCRSNELHVPAPRIGSKQRFEFALPEGHTVEFLQLVRDKCLVIISGPEKYQIYLEDSIRIGHVIGNRTSKRQLAHDRLGGNPTFAFDQSTRLLAVFHGSKDPKLITYSFDEQFSTLASRGSAFSLKEWYDTQVHIDKMCFVSGSEEICLINSTGHARILSLVTRHFRPASLTITGHIVDVFSAPDGSCIFVTVTTDNSAPSQQKLLAFHTASFGLNEDGINPTVLPPSDVRRVVTSFEGRNRIHVLSFSTERKAMVSTALQVKQKITEFSFRSNKSQSTSTIAETVNSCLLDCHMEVWTRFPVVPAVLRSTLVLSHGREPRRLIFASQGKLDEADSYFARMITKFEQTTRKPMDGPLSTISVAASSASPRALVQDFACSKFLLGGFVVELLCLIPLHLAITRDNRFIPLKDGVWDPVHESSLLGADVPTIIERLSLGWYESLLQSYMATKPVRVVSSMGEQSVGKSYCLNHFVDTSFAGSAMRTTEGVWLSCTPTEDYLLVSLDFEGVHSIERSAQEDALLVLFNTTISNLVLFRNNFALSRDIAGLFTSFQSSAMVLDPQANPGLFNSTLAIIIKDVTDSDSKDIVKEFSLKFQRIHLRRYLDKQPVTHPAGGIFLHNLKTLMAKIKASDWENLATHRALQLIERLQAALSRGRAEQGIESWGPLKNLDTDEDLPSMEQDVIFFVPDVSGNSNLEDESTIAQLLGDLVGHYGPSIGSRHALGDAEYVDRLQQQLFQVLDQRLAHVRHWIEKNVQRFPATNQDIRNIHGKFDNLALVMRTAVRVCSSTCAECHFQCILPSRHAGPHDCTTGHRCEHLCEVAEGHTSPVSCGLLAGHSAQHM